MKNNIIIKSILSICGICSGYFLKFALLIIATIVVVSIVMPTLAVVAIVVMALFVLKLIGFDPKGVLNKIIKKMKDFDTRSK